jgi:hypothetical protein
LSDLCVRETGAVMSSGSSSAFAGYRFPREVISVAVRWYLRYALSYRDVEELLAERGVTVDHVSVKVSRCEGCLCLSAVGEVVAQAGPPAAGALGDAGLVAGGEGPAGADLADVGGHQQQRGEDRLGGDAADPASGGLGEGLVSRVFDEPVEAFDGVAQGGVGVVPGWAAVGQVLAVAGADVRAMVIAVWRQILGGSGGGWSTLARPSRGGSEAWRSGQISPGCLPVAGQDRRWYPSASGPSLRLSW